MSFWSWIKGEPPGAVVPNDNGPANVHPGDPDGLELQGFDTPPEVRALPFPMATPWDGYPSNWTTPDWTTSTGLNRLVDAAWACVDLNSSVLSSMPVYRLRDGKIIDATSWMLNPDDMIYTSWHEFAKQLYWDLQVAGETFVLPMAHGADGYPLRFRVVPPWLINVELRAGRREYKLGQENVTDQILHIRYTSSTTDAHGHSPLEAAGARMTAISLLQKYTANLCETGGIPLYWLGIERRLSASESRDLLAQWIESRTQHIGQPAIVSGGATLNQTNSMNAHDMALLELSQFNESRIAILLGVPPFLVGLPGAGGLTYSNVSSLFDFHDRSSLRPKANVAMSALGGWALPRGQTVEANRDDYTRPDFNDRCAGYKILIELGVLSVEEVRAFERFYGTPAAVALTGGAD